VHIISVAKCDHRPKGQLEMRRVSDRKIAKNMFSMFGRTGAPTKGAQFFSMPEIPK